MREMVIKEAEGLYYGYTPRGEAVAASLEDLLAKLDPGVPTGASIAWAEVTEFLLGSQRRSHVVTGLMDDS